MSCGAGTIAKLDAGCSGQIVHLDCCPPIPQQEQELVRRWKQVRGGRFSTIPIPFGVANFSTIPLVGVIGPPAPGGGATFTVNPFIIPPNPPPNPTNTSGGGLTEQ